MAPVAKLGAFKDKHLGAINIKIESSLNYGCRCNASK